MEALSKEQQAWFNSQPEKLDGSERNMVALVHYPNPDGLHPVEVRYRNLLRKLIKRIERQDWQLEVQRKKLKTYKRMGLWQ